MKSLVAVLFWSLTAAASLMTPAERLLAGADQRIVELEQELRDLREHVKDVRFKWRQTEASAASAADYERIQLAFNDASEELSQQVVDLQMRTHAVEETLFEKLGLPGELGLVRHQGFWSIAHENKLIPFIHHYDREKREFMLTEAHFSPLARRGSELVIRVRLRGPSYSATFNRETDEGGVSMIRQWSQSPLQERTTVLDFSARQCMSLFR